MQNGGVYLNMNKKKDFLVSFAYWAIIGAGVYLALEYSSAEYPLPL